MDTPMRDTRKATVPRGYSVSYAVLPDGYECIVWDADVQPVYEYRAGNHPGCSQTQLDPDDPMRVRKPTLGKWARQNARDLAKEYGVPAGKVWRDHDAEQAAIEQWAEWRQRNA
jgi:hypothetical protein